VRAVTRSLSSSEADDRLVLQSAGSRTSLRDEAIKTLQAAIIAGELRPHVVYSAPTLAAQLRMSATPVREAVLDLVKEGLVETVRNKGFRVVELAAAELDELTELRLLIEVPSVRNLARRGLTAAEYRTLKQLATQIERAAVRNDMVAHNKADLEFHTALLGLLCNKTLVATVQSLRVRSRLYGMSRLADSGQLLPTSHEHTQLLDLIRDGDAAGAARLMRQHIGHVRGSWATGTADE
jgi:DNA-binding GntR family transcriptional regulator